MVGESVSSKAVSGKSIFGSIDTAATAISANRQAARSRDDIVKPHLLKDPMLWTRDCQLK
jgi:hypothetical protein